MMERNPRWGEGGPRVIMIKKSTAFDHEIKVTQLFHLIHMSLSNVVKLTVESKYGTLVLKLRVTRNYPKLCVPNHT